MKILLSLLLLALCLNTASAKADTIVGCPSGFVTGNGGECYWTQNVINSSGIVFTDLTWNNYDLECYGIVLSTSGSNALNMGWGPDGTIDTSTDYSWVQTFGDNTGAFGSTGGTANAFPLLSFIGATSQPSWFALHMGNLAQFGRIKGYTGTATIFNGATNFASVLGGHFLGSQDPITKITIAPASGTMDLDCTLYARPGL